MESWASPAPYVPFSPFPMLELELLFYLLQFQVAQGVSGKKHTHELFFPFSDDGRIQMGTGGPDYFGRSQVIIGFLKNTGTDRRIQQNPLGVVLTFFFLLKRKHTHVCKSADMPGNFTDSHSSKKVLLFLKEDRLKV